MWGVKILADAVHAHRQAVSPTNPLLESEHGVSDAIAYGLDTYRSCRDSAVEMVFKAVYESPELDALVGSKRGTVQQRLHEADSWLNEEVRRLKRREREASFEHGTFLGGAMRVLVYCGSELHVVDERPFNAMRKLLSESGLRHTIHLADLKQAARRQTLLVRWDEERTLAGLAQLLPTPSERRRALDAARVLAATRGDIVPAQQLRLDRVAAKLGLDPREKPSVRPLDSLPGSIECDFALR